MDGSKSEEERVEEIGQQATGKRKIVIVVSGDS